MGSYVTDIILQRPQVKFFQLFANSSSNHPAVGRGALVTLQTAVVASRLWEGVVVVGVYTEQQLPAVSKEDGRLAEESEGIGL